MKAFTFNIGHIYTTSTSADQIKPIKIHKIEVNMHYKLDKKDVGREGQNTIMFLYDWSVINYKHEQNLKDFFP